MFLELPWIRATISMGGFQETSAGTIDAVFVEKGFIYMGFVAAATRIMGDAQWLDIPRTSNLTQWAAIVGKYLDANPEQWNLNAEVLVYRALHGVAGEEGRTLVAPHRTRTTWGL